MKIQLIASNIIFKQFVTTALLAVAIFGLQSCDSEDPEKEDVPELITKVTLTFTPAAGGSPVVVIATDPDGAGLQPLEVDGPIELTKNTSYSLAISLINTLADPSAPEYNITEEVSEEGDEHMFFFAWTGNVFSNPAGNGNADNRNDAVNYNDEDANGQPLGLETSWTSTDVASDGAFRIILKHQPELKTSTSDSTVGETDLDISFEITVD